MTKFRANGIISLLDENLIYNLAESTTANLKLGDIFSPQLQDTLKYLHLGYGSSRGNEELRREIAKRFGSVAGLCADYEWRDGIAFPQRICAL